MSTEILRKAPFNLDDAGINWVTQTLASLTPEEKLGQLFVLISLGSDPQAAETLSAFQPAGITRFFSPDLSFERAQMAALKGRARVPLLVSADLEGSRMSLPFGSEVPNPLALAAIDDVDASRQIARIMAEEARAIGINWSYTPVLDINAAFRSPIVATRGFGSDLDKITRHAIAQIEEFQAGGVAATAKHWPGEGYDDRDQHLVTTINPLSPAAWEQNFGRLYRAAIAAGVKSVMSAHIALPEFVRSLNPDAGLEAFRPACISPVLNTNLLREKLGFNGVIVSDATPMAGLGAWGPRQQTLPQVISSGCDLILFTEDTAQDFGYIRAAIADGRITPERLEMALTRILGLKASLGLHLGAGRPEPGFSPENKVLARAVTARVPTLVKDVAGLLPLSPARYRRVLIVTKGIISPVHPGAISFDLPQMLADEGFEITHFTPGVAMTPDRFDLLLYLFGEETLLTRGRIFLDWAALHGHFTTAMDRPWHRIPTAMISFGYPYYLYDAPRVPTYINAYATMPTMQAAVVDCLMGRAAWNLSSPVDAFCGLEDARY